MAAARGNWTGLALLACLFAALPAFPGCRAAGSSPASYPGGPDSGTPLHGGKLVFLRETDPDYLDPALAYTLLGSPLVEACGRTLLGFPRRPGADMSRIEPDMAESMPAALEGGRVYALKVRADERFGPPVLRHVTAADFKYTIERLFRVDSPGLSFYLNIQGASDFQLHKAKEIRGLVARGDSLYVRLDSPRPAFLYALAMNFSIPVPPEVGEKHAQDYSQHIVSSGPFNLVEYSPRRRVVFVRNPVCRVQPFVDTVVVRLGVTAENAVAQIRKGQADGGFFELPASEYARLRRDPAEHDQVQVANDLSVYYLAPNTRIKPFNDIRVRQAAAWAMDRRALVKVWCGKGDVAYEVLPDGIPGHAPGELYLGPDLPKARELLRQAGYPDGVDVTLYARNEEPDPRTAEVFQAQLAEAGFRVKIEIIDGASFYAEVGRPSNNFQLMLGSWIMDFPEGSDFMDVLLNGERITDQHNNNLSLYDNKAVNAAVDRNLAELDPVRRAAEWTRIDRMVMKDCAVAPYLHARNTRYYARRLGGYFYHPIRVLYLDRVYIKAPLPAAGASVGAGAPSAARAAR